MKRLDLLILIFLLAFTAVSSVNQSNPTTPNPYFIFLTVGEVKPKGWIKEQMLRDWNQGYIGVFDKIVPIHLSQDRFGKGKVISGEKLKNLHGKPWWFGEHEGYWREAMVRVAYLTGDSSWINRVDDYMEHILRYQDKENGYIGIYKSGSRYNHTGENGELWTQSLIFRAMMAYYELTGRRQILESVEKAVGLTMNHYGPGQGYFKYYGGGISHGLDFVGALEWLYRITGKQEYVDFARFLYEDYSQSEEVRVKDMQLSRLLDMSIPFEGHCAHIMEELDIPLWLYYTTGIERYGKAGRNAYRKTEKYLLPSGAIISDEAVKGRNPLPSISAEYCPMTELSIALASALQKTGKSKYGDMTERVVFNAAQGARLASGKGVTYFTPDNRLQAAGTDRYGRDLCSVLHIANCCNLNAERLMPYYVSHMWMQRNSPSGGLAVVLYGPCSVHTQIKGIGVHIEALTDYPFDYEIRFRIEPEECMSFPLLFRDPSWSRETFISAPGAGIEREEGFFIVTKEWEDGDEVVVRFDPHIQRHFHNANNEYYLTHGPLVYALSIPARKEVKETYSSIPDRKFEKSAYFPTDKGGWYYKFGPRLDFEFKKISQADSLHPWEQLQFILKGSMLNSCSDTIEVELVPMGNTMLRRVTFPSE